MDLQTLRRKISRGEIDSVLVVFPDTWGRLVGKRATGRFFLDHVLKHGTHACDYLLVTNMELDPVDGFSLANWEKGFGDSLLAPDVSTLRPIPWQTATAMVFCDVHHHDGGLVEEAPRTVLRRQVAVLASRGLTCAIASELEFFLFNNTYHDAFQGRYEGLTPSSDYRIDYQTMQPARDETVLRALRNHLGEAGVPVETTKGEWGKGQHEINLQYDQPLPMADRHVLCKQAAKEIAAANGKSVTFMPKFSAAEAGNSCHIHASLWQRGRNIFWDTRKREGSKFFRRFLGGLMKYTPELCCFMAPSVNAYKRYQPMSWAPTKLVWAFDNRTAGFRVVGGKNSFRIENRMPGADANPYLAYAATIAAGMAGVAEQLDCGPLYEGNAYEDARLPALPHSLSEAADLLDKSKMARRSFGDAVVEFHVHTARMEARSYAQAVTDWERLRYFERI